MLTRTPVISSVLPSFEAVKIWDTDESNRLTLDWNENDTSDRTLNFLVNAANRNINLSGDLTLANNFTTSGNFALTFTLTGTTSLTLPTSGTLVTTADNLSVFAATTSAQLLGVISDETGSGLLVFATSPTLTTPTIAQINGSIASGGTLTLQSTTHATKGKILFGTSGYDEVNDRLGLGTQTPNARLELQVADVAGAQVTEIIRVGKDGYSTAGDGVSINFSTLSTRIEFVNAAASAGDIRLVAAASGVEKMLQWDRAGNLGILTTTYGTSASGVIAIANGTAPSDSVANEVQLYSADFAAGDARLYIKQEAGTITFPQSGTLATSANKLSDFAATTSLELLGVISDETGSGALVFANTPTLVTPILGTPTSGTLTNCTGLPVAGITSSTSTALGVGSLELGHATDTTISRVSAGVIAVEGAEVTTLANATTGTGSIVRATSPTLVTPTLGVATATSINGLVVTATAGTLTIPNNASAALVTSGNYSLTLTATAATNVTLPTTGTLATLAGAETLTNKTLNSNTNTIGASNLISFNCPQGYMINGKISATVATNDLTVAIKGLDGNDPSATNPVYININGTIRTLTAALSITLLDGTNYFNAGATHLASQEIDFFVYLFFKASDSSIVLGFARVPKYSPAYSEFSATNTNNYHLSVSAAPAAGDIGELIGRFGASLSATPDFNWTIGTKTINVPVYETRYLTYAPTWTGYSASPTGSARYQVRPKRCHCFFICSGYGTSNATSNAVDIPLPYQSGIATGGVAIVLGGAQYMKDNGSVLDDATPTITNAGDTQMGFSKSLSSGGWTASGNKGGWFDFQYITD